MCMVITCVGEFEGVPSKLELHDHVHHLLQGSAPSFPPSNELELTASATRQFIRHKAIPLT